MKIRVLIVEPSELIVSGLESMLASQSKFTVLESEPNMQNVPMRILSSKPDIVIVNATLLDATQLTDDTCYVGLVYQYVEQAHLRHFNAVLDIRDSRGAIVEKLTSVVNHKLRPEVTEEDTHRSLTKRETSVLILVAKGLMNKEIADKLNVSVHTVITHRKNIMQKTGIKSVAGLTVYAMLNNLIDESSLE